MDGLLRHLAYHFHRRSRINLSRRIKQHLGAIGIRLERVDLGFLVLDLTFNRSSVRACMASASRRFLF
jgi:hypothetical protein